MKWYAGRNGSRKRGETVLVATGSAARVGAGQADAPIDAAIVGIIDDGSQWG